MLTTIFMIGDSTMANKTEPDINPSMAGASCCPSGSMTPRPSASTPPMAAAR
ncbi:hypothetical protein [Cerasicoccus fimbriatus]|uniref:hypothetical protein n=1 Tax=Cerasicoccus fimbriatus TaxID=3014554 RepID=UPI0022B52CBF|nr:hypothetical protein [Cerasicoccus sp. TK19100]